MATYNDYSGWTTKPTTLQPRLEGSEKAEVAVIGGGFTGLMAAITLAEHDVDVALLEQAFCGFGASGRNAGHLTPTIGRDLVYCLKTFGRDKGLKLAAFAEDAVHFTENLFQHYGIECGYSACGNIVAGVHKKQRTLLVAAAEACNQAGISIQFLDEAQVRDRNLPSLVRFGLQESAGGLLNPGKYVMALRDIAISRGVRIYEQTAVEQIEYGPKVQLRTETGTLSADKVLIATNAFTAPGLNIMHSAVVPLRVTLFNTQPLSASELSTIGWSGREGIYTAHNLLENFRLTADNRISGGSKWVQYGYGSALVNGDQPWVFSAFEQLLKVRFPELPNMKIDQFWGGWIGMTLDMLPVCGVDRAAGNVYHCIGYNGHGIAQASKMGRVMALEMLGYAQPEVKLFQRRQIPLPPEPLRWMTVNGMRLVMGLKDQQVDKLLRNAQRDNGVRK